jgi:hypothetical protein
MQMCKSLGVTPAEFKKSRDQLSTTEALVNRKKSAAELTADQLKLCHQVGITPEEFWEARQRLINEGYITEAL